MSKKISLVQVFALIFAVGMLTQCNAQGKKNEAKVATNTAAVVSEPAEGFKVEGNIPDYEIRETGLDYLQSLKMPEVYLVFKANNSKLELPADAKDILNTHWKEAIEFFYDEEFNTLPKGQETYNRDKTWSVYCIKTHQKLQKITIEAPSGKRNISQTEALELWGFLNGAAAELIDKVKDFK